MSQRLICFHFISLLLIQLKAPFAGALEIIDGKNQLTCGQGLTDCSVKDVALPGMKGPVNVNQLELRVFLCCTNNKECFPCLRVQVNFTIKDQNEDQEMSGDHREEDVSSKQTEEGQGSALGMPPSPTEYSVRVCYSHPGFMDRCKEVTFTLSHSVLEDLQSHEMWLFLLLNPVTYGSPVNVKSSPRTGTITFPSLEEVCSPNLDVFVKDCDVPMLRATIDEKRSVALLQLDSSNQTVVICTFMYTPSLTFGTKEPDKCHEWHAGQSEMTVPLSTVTPCLCFKVWWKGKKLRREVCPFVKNKELIKRMWHDNVSISLEEAQTNAENGTALSWKLATPCQLEGELWLCRKASVEGHCDEVNGSRQRMFNQSHVRGTSTINSLWLVGEFFDVKPHPALCFQMEIQGMDTKLDPLCPFTTPRNRWSLIVMIGILLICLAILGAYAVHSTLKRYVWRWLKDDDIRGAVGGGHIVLLYPPDRDQALPGLVCRLATSLSSLGFSVSLDLWSHTELSVLGPVPWLHSRLDRLQRQGGKVVLVLTQAAWEKAEEWGSWGWERDTLQKRGCIEDAETVKVCRSTYSDVFSASFSCILADYLQGRAGERFTLVQFESLPPQPPGGGRPLPELFRGLQLFSLPSQSLAFLTELAFGRGRGAVAGRRKRAGGLRAASRALAGGLREFAGRSAVLRLTGLPQDCVGARVEDPWESVPLQHCVTSAPSSPDTCPMARGMDWV
ncbi:interleukin-17 receptor C isoform X2 [Esox lucius]|uniref:SEFIR domain-containing protein n=1 Tax=Esox lucius TaxID=8010 RepID=A0A3P8YR00_ESOLU|nr:interleukin-17 receptor C isoform X2 [Esox lucius]